MPIHIAITRRMLPGKEAEFKQAQRRFLGESFIHGGVQGPGMITSMPGAHERDIGILRRPRAMIELIPAFARKHDIIDVFHKLG